MCMRPFLIRTSPMGERQSDGGAMIFVSAMAEMSLMLPSLPRSWGLDFGSTPAFPQTSEASLSVIRQKSFFRKSFTVFCEDWAE